MGFDQSRRLHSTSLHVRKQEIDSECEGRCHTKDVFKYLLSKKHHRFRLHNFLISYIFNTSILLMREKMQINLSCYGKVGGTHKFLWEWKWWVIFLLSLQRYEPWPTASRALTTWVFLLRRSLICIDTIE